MLSMKEGNPVVSSSYASAVYKGLQVAVYSVDKTELSLTRQDLVELINVRSIHIHSNIYFIVQFDFCLSFCVFYVCVCFYVIASVCCLCCMN